MNGYDYLIQSLLYVSIITAQLPTNNVSKVTNQSTITVEKNKLEPTGSLPASSGSSWHGKLRKCCKLHEIWLENNKTCISGDLHGVRIADLYAANYSNFTIVYNSRCPDKYYQPEVTGSYHLLNNGTMVLENKERLTSYYSPDKFCIDYIKDISELQPIVCFDPSAPPQENELKFVLFLFALSTSMLFLMATFCLYVMTPKLRQKVHDKCFLCHIFTLIVGFASLVAIQNIGLENSFCGVLAYMTQFWMLASIFWVNIMCVDVWRSVAATRFNFGSKVRKFTMYCLYGWGCPFLIFILTLLSSTWVPSGHTLHPGFLIDCCWFRSYKGIDQFWLDPRFIYYYSFVAVTLLINICLFTHTALIIWRENRNWDKKRRDISNSRRHKIRQTRFFLYLKLFSVMGLYWIIDVASYFHGDEKVSLTWIILDVITALQGIPIFIIFICNRRAISYLNQRFWPRKTFLREYQKTISTDRTPSVASKFSKLSISEYPER